MQGRALGCCFGAARLALRLRVLPQVGQASQAQRGGHVLLAGALAAGLALVSGSPTPTSRRRRPGNSQSWLSLEEVKSPPAVKRPAVGNVNVDQEMLKRRTIFITGEVNDETAKALMQQLLWLEAEDPHAPVTIFINSGGGLVHSGVAMIDAMLAASMPLKTVAYGRCFSIAALVLAAGTHGHRSAYENARLMIHEPACSYPKLQVSDIAIRVEELRHNSHTLARILGERTGKSEAELIDAFTRDRYMAAAEAKEFGVIDYIRPTRSKGLLEERVAAHTGSLPTPTVPAPAPAQPAPAPAAAS